MRILLILCCLWLSTPPASFAQEDLTAWSRKVERAGLQVDTSALRNWKPQEAVFNTLFPHQYRWKHPSGKGHLLLAFRSASNAPFLQFPHLEARRAQLTMAVNHEDAPIVEHPLPDSLLQHYHADWGATAFFQPKPSFSPHRHACATFLYQENLGLLYLVYLFNRPKDFEPSIPKMFRFLPAE